MSPLERSAQDSGTATLTERSQCPRCRSYLRSGHEPDAANPHGLCDPCLALVESCAPFAGGDCPGQAPDDVNLLELAAGLMLTHDALHHGQLLYLREELAAHGVDVDHVQVQQIANKLRRRHGLILRGESRKAGYAVEDWTWEARRVRSSLAGG